jgi:5-oxoprolinase (ATP-hydrolysing) subunit C
MLELLEPGLLTLVQGVPYRGSRHRGLPLAGAADPVALALANWLVGNGPEVPALETAYAPLRMRAYTDCTVAIQGAASEVYIDGQMHPTAQSLHLAEGTELYIPAPKGGCRSYVAIRGGIAVATVIGATSTYLPAKLGGLDGSALSSGAIISANAAGPCPIRSLSNDFQLRYGMEFLLRITNGPENDWIEPTAFTSQQRTVSRRADRIGIELEGAPIKPLRTDQLESSAVFPGTIQCPPSGLPFLLGPDAQTTGGYPRIAQVIRADRHLIGQLRPSARVRFQRIEPAEARRLYRSKIALIRQLQPDFRLD